MRYTYVMLAATATGVVPRRTVGTAHSVFFYPCPSPLPQASSFKAQDQLATPSLGLTLTCARTLKLVPPTVLRYRRPFHLNLQPISLGSKPSTSRMAWNRSESSLSSIKLFMLTLRQRRCRRFEHPQRTSPQHHDSFHPPRTIYSRGDI